MLDTATTILTGRPSLLQLAQSVVPVSRAVLFAPKSFFGTIGAASGLSVVNALGFFTVAVTLYVALENLFELGLIHFAGYETQTLIDYYAAPFAAEGIPLAEALGFLTAVGIVGATLLFAVAQWTVSIWLLATAFIHSGKVASAKAMLVAGLYATGAIILALSAISLPAYYFDNGSDTQSFMATPGTLLHDIAKFATAAGLQAKYEAIFTYLYLRSISFTTDLRLHWGLIFTILLAAAVMLVMSVR
jgi:hypothetical protein